MPGLTAEAVAAYRRAGWRVTEFGRPDAGVTTGPCARCGQATVRYGLAGNPVCPACEERTRAVAAVNDGGPLENTHR